MIEQRKLKDLIKLMVDNDLTELDLQDEKESVSLKRAVGQQHVQVAPAPAEPPPPAAAAPPQEAAPAKADTNEGLIPITSPMVGTFYAAQSPDAEPLVTTGDAVQPDSVVCIIEAMKVFNEIKSEVKGTIAQILVENGQAVEFGQELFLVKPA